jgi:hypothetical protein
VGPNPSKSSKSISVARRSYKQSSPSFSSFIFVAQVSIDQVQVAQVSINQILLVAQVLFVTQVLRFGEGETKGGGGLVP